MYILTLSPLLIYEGRSNYCKFIFISHQVLKPWNELPCVDKRNIDHIYINCWFAVYRWSVIEKQKTSTPHPHTNIWKCACVWRGWFWLPVFTLLTNSRLKTSSYTGNSEISLYNFTDLVYIVQKPAAIAGEKAENVLEIGQYKVGRGIFIRGVGYL